MTDPDAPTSRPAVPVGARVAVLDATPRGDDGLADPGAPGGAADEVEVFQAFAHVLRLNRQLMLRAHGSDGPHPGQGACLRILARHDGIAQRELADLLHVSPPTITSMLQRMERAGMVVRRVDDADQRMTRVHISAEGLRLEAGFRDILAANMHRVLGPMSAADRRELARLLGVMADNMKQALE